MADDTSDPSIGNANAITPGQLANLSPELRAELLARQGEAWIRGFAYAPENHWPAEVRDGCDFTSVDLPALSAPSGLALAEVAGGTLVAGTYTYEITAVNANGETTPSASVAITTTSTGSVTLTWAPEADGLQFKVYGRIAGSLGLLAVVGPFDKDQTPTYTDAGAAVVGAIPPTTNTTGGAGSYGNLPMISVIPFLIMAEDVCSSFGFEERDFKGRALRLLDNATPKAIESEFWTGALAQAKGYPNNYLTNTASVTNLTPGSGATSVARGMQILQDALATSGFGGQGMIHVQPQTAPNLLGARRVGQLLLDIFDNIVVPGVGYPGTGPGGVTPSAGTAYMYATDLVMVRSQNKGTVFPDSFAEALDRGQSGEPNTIRFRAERFAAAYFDASAHYCVQVTLAT